MPGDCADQFGNLSHQYDRGPVLYWYLLFGGGGTPGRHGETAAKGEVMDKCF